MRPTRRDRRCLAAIEIELQRDERLQEVFDCSVWPDQEPTRAHRSRLRDHILEPPSHTSAYLRCIALQLCAVAGCTLAASAKQNLVIIVVMALYPCAFTPLVRWSAQHPSGHVR